MKNKKQKQLKLKTRKKISYIKFKYNLPLESEMFANKIQLCKQMILQIKFNSKLFFKNLIDLICRFEIAFGSRKIINLRN